MSKEELSSQKLEKNPQLKEAVNVLKFFNVRIRKELKNREKST